MTTPARFRLVFAARGDLLEAARALEQQALGHPPGTHPDELQRYEASSLFLAVADGTGRVVGAARMVLPGPAGFKTINDLPHGTRAARAVRIDEARTWDVASFSVEPGADGLVAAALCHGIVQALRTNRVRAVVMSVDDRTRQLLSLVGLQPGPLPGSLPGSPPGPLPGSLHRRGTGAPARSALWGYVTALLDGQRRVNPDGYRLVSQGLGLDGVTVPEPAHLLVASPLRAGLAWAAVQTLAPGA